VTTMRRKNFGKGLWGVCKRFAGWIHNLFVGEYQITVYRESSTVGGQMYKSVYTARKLIIQKEKHLKFRDWETKKMIEIRSSGGLDYKIEEI